MKKSILTTIISQASSISFAHVEKQLVPERLCDLEKKYEVQFSENNLFVLKKHPWFPNWEIELLKESNSFYYGQNGYVFSKFWVLENNSYALTSG
jgi:hypothetical protein